MAKLPLDPIALYSLAILFTDRETDPNSLAAVALAVEDKSGTWADRAPAVYPVKIIAAAQAIPDRQHLHGQGFAAMGAAAGQDLPAAFGAHPGQEAVNRLVDPSFRLIGAFDHFFSSLWAPGDRKR